MLDRFARPLIDPPLTLLGQRLARYGATANVVTLAGLGLGLLAVPAIVFGLWGWALVAILTSRVADGLDGAVARATRQSDLGGYFDIIADFAFYAAVPLAFVWADPATNGSAGTALLAAFYINGATFLGFAILAAKRGLTTEARGKKSWYHAGGLLEGSETIGFFIAFCLWPTAFVPIAWAFAVLCLLTAVQRVAVSWDQFHDQG